MMDWIMKWSWRLTTDRQLRAEREWCEKWMEMEKWDNSCYVTMQLVEESKLRLHLYIKPEMVRRGIWTTDSNK